LNGRSSFEQLLSNVFDPSLVIGAAYQARVVVTADGRVLTGLVAEESDQRVVLKMQGGKQETIPRSEVEELKVSRLSLMPEDLEQQLKPQELADLFAYITLDKPPGDPMARKLPGSQPVVPRETNDPKQFAELLGQIAPGFTVGRVHRSGLAIVAEHYGREGVLRTRPVNSQNPAILRAELPLPAGKRTRLVIGVAPQPEGSVHLKVTASGQTLHDALLGPFEPAELWQTISLDLTPLAGKTAKIEVLQSAVGDQPDAAFWERIELVSE
jgi:putative heme-binding domain-containing protein